MTLETNRYQAARRFLQDGRREWALVIAGELLRSGSGRSLGMRLLEEMYPDGNGMVAAVRQAPDGNEAGWHDWPEQLETPEPVLCLAANAAELQ